MSFSGARNVNGHRNQQDGSSVWPGAGSNGYSRSNMGAKLDGYFDKRELPMYKDKPYNYASSRRRPLWQKWRFTLGLLLLLGALLYWVGIFSPTSTKTNVKDTSKGTWSWLNKPAGPRVDWDERREKVKDAFMLSWGGYEKYAWGEFPTHRFNISSIGNRSNHVSTSIVKVALEADTCSGQDQYHPTSKKGTQMTPNGMGWIIVDALDTLMIMNLTSPLKHAREWITTSLNYEQDQEINTFETTIRMLGGLLSAHYLSTEFPDMAPLADDDQGAPGEDLYLEKATDLADRLLGAFDSESGVPYASVNLKTLKGIRSHADDGASSTAEATSLQLEFKYLAMLTGEKDYWEKVEKVMKVVDDNGAEDGLVPIFVYAHDGTFRGQNIRLGSRGDSYYGDHFKKESISMVCGLIQDRISDQTISSDFGRGAYLPRSLEPSPDWRPQTSNHLFQEKSLHHPRRATERPQERPAAQDGPSRMLHARNYCPGCHRRQNTSRSQRGRQMGQERTIRLESRNRIDKDLLGHVQNHRYRPRPGNHLL